MRGNKANQNTVFDLSLGKTVGTFFTVLSFVLFLLNPPVIQAQNNDFDLVVRFPVDHKSPFPLENLEYSRPRELKVALVLSGGGARGLAHIGVLKALEEAHIPINLIVGCSMGSVTGGFYASGYSVAAMERIMKRIDWGKIYTDETSRPNLFWSQKSVPRRHILELRLEKGVPTIPYSISQGQRILNVLYSLLLKSSFQAGNDFDNLKIPFRAVATDLLSGQRVVLKSGDLAEAISASISVPLLFAPVEWNGMWLVDGGIRDNLPVDVALENGADLVIAVDVTSPLRTKDQIRLPWQLADQVTTIMMKEPTAQNRKLADILIAPQLGRHGAGDFSRMDSLIEAGYQAAKQQIAQIKQKIQQKKKHLWGDNDYLGRVAAIRMVGLQRLNLDSLFSSLRTEKGRSLYLYDLYEDLRRLLNTGLLADARVVLQGNPAGYEVVFQLTENPYVQQISFTGNKILSDSLLGSFMTLDLPGTLPLKQLFNCLDGVLNTYYQKGYVLTRITKIAYDSSAHKLTIHLNEGKISRIKILGNRNTRDYIILREFPLKVGDYFRASLAQQGIRNIYSTGLFSKVTLNVEEQPNGNVLIIKVKEKHHVLMRLGLNASVERKSKALLEFAEENFLGRLIKISLFGTIGDLARSAEFHMFSVRFLNTYLTYHLSFYYRERWDRYFQSLDYVGDYLTIRRGFRFVVGQQIERLGSISMEFRLDGVNVYSELSDFPYRDRYGVRSFTVRSVVDKRDKLPFPDTGINNRWYWETGSKRLLGGSEGFTRFHISLEGYYPLSSYFNYHITAAGGSSDLTLPFSEFFQFGGLGDFPGLYEREMLGRQFLKFGNELRFKIPWKRPIDIYLTGGFHIGAMWKTSEELIQRSDFLTAFGFQISADTILGPLILGYGKVTHNEPLIYLSLGYSF